MLTAHRQNVHHSRLPAPGALVIVHVDDRRMGGAPAPGHRFRRLIVESFPLSDAADQRYSRGIHTCTLRALDNGARFRVAGHWCEEIPA